ncbi:MAG TPA: DUF4397 domain-containing protein [Phycisphaerae bacterium]|jgi:hypothetical protein
MLSQAGGEKKEAPKAGMSAAAGHATVIFVHASPDTANADIYVNDKKVGTIAYGKAESKEIDAGSAKIELKSGDKSVVSTTTTVAADKNYTIVVTGKTGMVKAEAIEAKYTMGKGHATIVNALADPIDINVDGKSAKAGLAAGQKFDADWDAGKHKVDIMSGSAAAIASKDIETKADAAYVIVASGSATGTPKAELIVASHGPMKKAAPAPEKK